ncbi:hypothetical protein [Lysinibacillus xylanilyticus]
MASLPIPAKTLITADDENFNVTRVSYDTYNGEQELIKAYY